jgi:hypothetical protein
VRWTRRREETAIEVRPNKKINNMRLKQVGGIALKGKKHREEQKGT